MSSTKNITTYNTSYPLKLKINGSSAFIILIFIFLSFSSSVKAQENVSDSTFQKNVAVLDKIDSSSTDNFHSPKKAGWMSAALPGLGQAYNKKYWKIPVIYAAFGTITYFLVMNNAEYVKYRDAYIMRTDDDPTNDDILPRYTTENLRFFKNQYWKNRDLNIILLAGVYTLNILDAVVDAHFYTYNISDDLALRVTPTATPLLRFGSPTSASVGLSFSLTF